MGKLRDKYGINTGKLRDKYGKNVLEVLILLFTKNTITLTEAAEKLNISLSTVEKAVSKLRKENIIERTGSRKGGSWEIKEQKP